MLARCPGSAVALRAAARAPIGLKTPLFQRVASAVAAKCDLGDGLIETNGGISDRLRILLPARKHEMLFGRPSNNDAERATLALVEALSLRSEAFIDVGANEGIFPMAVALAASSGRTPSIHAFEPDTVLFDRLIINLRRNGIESRANNTAVAAKTGFETFYRNLSDDCSGSLVDVFADKHELVAVEVESIALADYLERHSIEHACVKVDVEGAGQQVWRGMRAGYKRIDWLISEVLEPDVKARLPLNIMSDTGWCAYYIRDFDLVQSVDGSFRYQPPFFNWLFCPMAPEQLAGVLSSSRFRVITADAAPV
jgi:FkbM family methyltransferase